MGREKRILNVGGIYFFLARKVIREIVLIEQTLVRLIHRVIHRAMNSISTDLSTGE
jgi:hypothetical protein